MATTGPVPNRSSDLSRERDANRGDRAPITKGVALPTSWPKAKPEWCDTAKELYAAARKSGQREYYQQSDIAMLRFMCDEITGYLEPRPLKDRDGNPVIDEETGEVKTYVKRSPMHLTAIMSAMQELLITEGSRRRVRVELEEPKVEDDAAVLAIADYKKELGLES